jgi:predicted small metal-binding protein
LSKKCIDAITSTVGVNDRSKETNLSILVQPVVMKTLSCREAGFDCDYIVEGETEEEILQKGAEHARMDHGLKEEDCTPEFKEKLKGLIKTA